MSANFFQVLGVHAVLGRTFLPEEDQRGKDNVVILSYRLWQDRFGADPNIIGRSLVVNDSSRTVVGVMPSGFSYNKLREIVGVVADAKGRSLTAAPPPEMYVVYVQRPWQ